MKWHTSGCQESINLVTTFCAQGKESMSHPLQFLAVTCTESCIIFVSAASQQLLRVLQRSSLLGIKGTNGGVWGRGTARGFRLMKTE